MKKIIILYIVVIFVLMTSVVPAVENSLPSPSSSFARSAAMGGAFTAVEDDFENILFNAAAMRPHALVDKHFSLSLNPAGAALSACYYNSLTSSPKIDSEYLLALGGLLVRHISFANQTVQFSILLSEDLRKATFDSSSFSNFNTDGLLDNYYHASAIRITPAQQISIGVSGYYFNIAKDGQRQTPALGGGYSILIKPSAALSAGVSYFYFPDAVDSLMFDLYGLKKRTVNAGIVYSPLYRLKFAVDARNISGDEGSSPGQIRAGIEVLPGYFFALRGGYAQKAKNSHYVTLGFGIGDFRPFRTESSFVFSNILLNYALETEIEKPDALRHSLTFLIRF